LLARRLVEKGVRFIQLFDWGWDFHGTKAEEDIGDNLIRRCSAMDRAVAALILDLKSRGLLDETLVVWMGEFGRTPFREGRTAAGPHIGRDHHPFSNTMFMAGGGLKHGFTLGATDELGFHVTENAVQVHDVQATLLHLLGLDHTKLTYRFQGRDYRLTDVDGRVIKEVLA
jgi:arylsulfatase A-like enzyme